MDQYTSPLSDEERALLLKVATHALIGSRNRMPDHGRRLLNMKRRDPDALYDMVLKLCIIADKYWDTLESLTAKHQRALLEIQDLGTELEECKARNPAPKPTRKSLRPEVRRAVLRRDGYTCRYCGAKYPHMHVDHIHPVSRGGSDEIENLCACCQPCNMSKGSKMLDEWTNRPVPMTIRQLHPSDA